MSLSYLKATLRESAGTGVQAVYPELFAPLPALRRSGTPRRPLPVSQCFAHVSTANFSWSHGYHRVAERLAPVESSCVRLPQRNAATQGPTTNISHKIAAAVVWWWRSACDVDGFALLTCNTWERRYAPPGHDYVAWRCKEAGCVAAQPFSRARSISSFHFING